MLVGSVPMTPSPDNFDFCDNVVVVLSKRPGDQSTRLTGRGYSVRSIERVQWDRKDSYIRNGPLMA